MSTAKWVLMIAASYFIYRKMAAPLESLSESAGKALDNFTYPLAVLAAEAQFIINGSNYIKSPTSEFYLNPDKLDVNYKVVNRTWLKAMYAKHNQNGDLIEEIFDPYLRLKPKYYPLVGGLVDANTVNALK